MTDASLPISEFELLRIIDFVDDIRIPFGTIMSVADDEAIWNIVSELVRAEVCGRMVTLTALTEVSGLPYATSRRVIKKLIADGQIVQVSRSQTGKSFALHPSDELMSEFMAYARKVKSLIVAMAGMPSSGGADDDYYLGAGQQPQGAASGPVGNATDNPRLRFLMNRDTYSQAMRNMWSDFRSKRGSAQDFSLHSIESVWSKILENGAREVSVYDVVAVSLPWLPELAERGLLARVEDVPLAMDVPDGLAAVSDMGQWRGCRYGIPVYASASLFALRADLFSQAGLKAPGRPQEVLDAARLLNDPRKDLAGLVWLGAEGPPLAQSFMFFMADFGMPFLALSPNGNGELVAQVDSDTGREVLSFMHELLEVSPPNVLDLSWEEALRVFYEGRGAMSYCWTLGAVQFEYHLRSLVKRRVSYLPHPGRNGDDGGLPLGGFLFCVPSNLPSDRQKRAVEAIHLLTADMRRSGSDGIKARFLPGFALNADPEIQAGAPIAAAVAKWTAKGKLHTRARPATEHNAALETILGQELHLALRGQKADTTALRDAQRRMTTLLRR